MLPLPGQKGGQLLGTATELQAETVHPWSLVTSLLPYPGVWLHFYSPSTGHPLPLRECYKDRTQPQPDKCFRHRSGQDSDPRQRGTQGKCRDGRRSPSAELPAVGHKQAEPTGPPGTRRWAWEAGGWDSTHPQRRAGGQRMYVPRNGIWRPQVAHHHPAPHCAHCLPGL